MIYNLLTTTTSASSIGQVTGDFFSIFQSFFNFITANPLVAFACFAPVVVVTISLLIHAFR